MIYGNDGNDYLNGGGGADSLYGGYGLDTLYVSDGDHAYGGKDNDTFIDESTGNGSNSWAFIYGNEGDDIVQGGAGSLQFCGGAGDDTIIGGIGSIYFWSGNDAGVSSSISGNFGNDMIFGSSVGDIVYASGGNDYIAGNCGGDTLRAYGGNDVVQGGEGIDIILGGIGNNLLDGGKDIDTLTGNTGNEIFIGGTGNDTITTGTGADIIAFNQGDGQDTVNASTGADNTLSLGGGIKLDSLTLSKTGNNLILGTGNSDQITLKDWYASANNRSIVTLQVINAASTNPEFDNKVESFNFATLASNFDTALAANSSLSNWSLMDSLLTTHLLGSDTSALGGDLAYQYGMNGSLTGVGLTAAQDVLANAYLGSQAQTLNSWQTVSSGAVKLS